MIVESAAYLGSYEKSPFTFKRNWEVIGGIFDNTQNALQSENNYLKSSLDDLKSQMSTLVTMLQNQQQSALNNQANLEADSESENESLQAKRISRRKNKKNLKKQKTSNVDKPSTSILGRIYNTFQSTENVIDHDTMSDIQSVSSGIEPRVSDVCSGFQGPSTNYWIESLELELMSSPLDQLASRCVFYKKKFSHKNYDFHKN